MKTLKSSKWCIMEENGRFWIRIDVRDPHGRLMDRSSFSRNSSSERTSTSVHQTNIGQFDNQKSTRGTESTTQSGLTESSKPINSRLEDEAMIPLYYCNLIHYWFDHGGIIKGVVHHLFGGYHIFDSILVCSHGITISTPQQLMDKLHECYPKSEGNIEARSNLLQLDVPPRQWW